MNFDLVTASFMEQVLYTTAVREVLAGIAPENSERLYELRQFKHYKMGTALSTGTTALHRAETLSRVIREHHASVKVLADMINEERDDKQAIIDYINELTAEAELAVQELKSLKVDTLDE